MNDDHRAALEAAWDATAAVTAEFPARYRHAEASRPEVRQWARKPHGVLLLTGGVGEGKTHEFYGLLREWLILRRLIGGTPDGTTGHCVWRMPDLCAVARDFKRRDETEAARTLNERGWRHSLLVLDDVGVEADNDANRETFWRVIDNRYVACLPTVISTNITPGDFAARFGERVADRISEDLTTVAFTEGSTRGLNIKREPLGRDQYIARFTTFHPRAGGGHA